LYIFKKKLFSIILMSLVLLSCQKKETTTNTLRLNFQEGDLPSLHPHSLMIYLRGLCIAKNLFECLTRIDENGKAQLAGAKSVDVSSDQLHYTFVLRDNKWSDGTLVTAYQYEQAWKDVLSPNSTSSRADLLYILKNAIEVKKGEIPLEELGVKALDDKTLSVELAYPSPYFLELVAQPICAPLVDLSKKEPLVFNGPFFVDSWKRNDKLRLKANPHFWDKEHISLKQIDIFMVQDVMSAFSLYEKNEIDWMGAPLCLLSNELSDQFKKNHSLKSQPIDRAFWIFLNTTHPCLSSPTIRQALSLAIDRSMITTHILINGHPLNKPLAFGLLPIPVQDGLKENLSEARLKFEQGLKELSLTKKTFPPLVISFSQQANRKQIAEYLQEVWSSAFGIQVQVQAEEWNVLRSNLEKGLFEISGCFEAAFYNDPLEIFEKFASINPSNFSKWVYPAFVEKVSLAKRESNPKKRMELLAEAEQILIEQLPVIPICSDVLHFTHPPGLEGYIFDYVGAVDFSRASFIR